ncbi:hypothetical protein EDD18DRAFT_1346969 [Armillaria luteobubalina]|uniref:Secreted protein n=1 Tax=Armillaria luteobubalina TaxID=153913 RepID=A0AA39QIT9_9AGAR|nr:hypothetical protein EDD18DRAFT_1346969 [Armillaria luteobubalina]
MYCTKPFTLGLMLVPIFIDTVAPQQVAIDFDDGAQINGVHDARGQRRGNDHCNHRPRRRLANAVALACAALFTLKIRAVGGRSFRNNGLTECKVLILLSLARKPKLAIFLAHSALVRTCDLPYFSRNGGLQMMTSRECDDGGGDISLRSSLQKLSITTRLEATIYGMTSA